VDLQCYHPTAASHNYHPDYNPLGYHSTHNTYGYHPELNDYGHHQQANPDGYHPTVNPTAYPATFILGENYDGKDEATRCVRGHYCPGLPSDASKSDTRKTNSGAADADAPANDLGGLIIQCDICKVWQHSRCVGAIHEVARPDEYFCEACRKDLREGTTSAEG
jgi:hypothetical protein